jgi:hypothetical protein
MLVRSRKRRRPAATAMEYLVVASFILIAAIYAISFLGRSAQEKMQQDATAIENATNGNTPSGP